MSEAVKWHLNTFTLCGGSTAACLHMINEFVSNTPTIWMIIKKKNQRGCESTGEWPMYVRSNIWQEGLSGPTTPQSGWCSTHFCNRVSPDWVLLEGVTRYRRWLSHYATSRNVAVSIPDEDSSFFNWPNSSGLTVALGSTESLTELTTKNVPGATDESAI
jgi:hypothetical protein